MEDSRFVLLNARDAAAHGAEIMTRTKVVSAEPVDGAWRVTLEDQDTGKIHVRHARMLINAAGPWVAEVIRTAMRQNAGQKVRLVRGTLPDATLCYMNPIKQETSIREAFQQHDVRIFSLDSKEELEKISRATGHAEDLTLCVRLQVASEFAEIRLATKFGVEVDEAAELLQGDRQAADQTGVCFHAGC